MLNPELDNAGRKRVLITTAVLVTCIIVFLSLFFWKMTQPRALSRDELNANGLVMYEMPRRFDDFQFVDDEGNSFTREDFVGKWTMVFPGYTFCPDICPVTMAELARFWDLLDERPKSDLQVVMLSVDPNRDTPERLNDYVSYFNEEFIGITSDLATLSRAGAQWNVAFTIVNPAEVEEYYTVDHSGNILLINPAGHYQGFFRPPFDPTRLKLTYQSVWVTNR